MSRRGSSMRSRPSSAGGPRHRSASGRRAPRLGALGRRAPRFWREPGGNDRIRLASAPLRCRPLSDRRTVFCRGRTVADGDQFLERRQLQQFVHVAQRCGGCDGWIRVSVGQMFIVTNIDLSIPSVVTLGAYVALLTISGGTQTSSGCSCRPLIFGGATSAIGVFFANVLLILVVTLTQIMQLPHGSQDMVQASSSFLCSRWRDTKPIGRAAPTRSGPRYRLRCVADAFSRRSAPTRASRGPCSQIR